MNKFLIQSFKSKTIRNIMLKVVGKQFFTHIPNE